VRIKGSSLARVLNGILSISLSPTSTKVYVRDGHCRKPIAVPFLGVDAFPGFGKYIS